MAMENILCLNKVARQRGLRAGRSVGARRSIVVVLSSALVLAAGMVAAAEIPSGDARGSHTIAVIDPGLLIPGALTIGQGEAVDFTNYSSETIRLVFTEPKDSAEEIRCRRGANPDTTAGSDTTVGSPVFASGATDHLTVTIPPGRYTTACSLTPGRYSFVTKRLGRDPRSPLDALGQKGTISVE